MRTVMRGVCLISNIAPFLDVVVLLE
jgi:hypothetical protein